MVPNIIIAKCPNKKVRLVFWTSRADSQMEFHSWQIDRTHYSIKWNSFRIFFCAILLKMGRVFNFTFDASLHSIITFNVHSLTLELFSSFWCSCSPFSKFRWRTKNTEWWEMRAGDETRSKWMPLMEPFARWQQKIWNERRLCVSNFMKFFLLFIRFQWHKLKSEKCKNLTISPIHHSPGLLLSYSRYKIKADIFTIFFIIFFADSTNYNIFNSCITQNKKNIECFSKKETKQILMSCYFIRI